MSRLEGVDEIVVIDNGAYHIRIASVPYPAPSTARALPDIDIGVYPNFIARARSSSNRKSYVSSQILTDLDEYGGLVLRQPHQKGMISDWAAQKLIWDHVFASHFDFARPPNKRWLEGKAVIITESYHSLDEVSQATDLMLFEQYGAQALWRCDSASLAAWTDLYDLSAKQAQEASTISKGEKFADHRDEQPKPAKRSRQSRDSVTSTPYRVSHESDTTPAKAIARFRRPESFLILDLSYSACHAVPVVRGEVQYKHTKRLDIGGKILTNLLKETLSFRQLDMMDEFWLVEHIRRRTNFVASHAGTSNARSFKPELLIADMRNHAHCSTTAPCDWTFDQLLTLCKFGHRRRGLDQSTPDVTLQWKLPDYSSTSTASGGAIARNGDFSQDEKEEIRKYGTIVSGPDPGLRPVSLTSHHQPLDEDDRIFDAAYIAQTTLNASSNRMVPSAAETVLARDNEEEEDPQFLTLSNERFTVPEVLFAPSMIGLSQNGVAELAAEAVASFVKALPGSSSDSGDLMWANILLIGGLSNIPGLKRRLLHELRRLAPADIPTIHLRTGVKSPQHRYADLLPVRAGIILASSAPSTLEYEWLHSRWLTSTEWSQSSNPLALAKQRFAKP